jgi:Ca-activated chloride channel family protein
MEGVHLLRPWWLLALLPWLGLCWRLWRGGGAGAWRAVCDPALLPYLLEGAPARRRRSGAWLLALAGTLAILALSGPAWREVPQPVYRGQQALVLVLDLSRSMNADDVAPSRLARARLKVRDLLRRRVDGQTALVVFAGDAFAVTPLTDDVDTVDALVPGLDSEMLPRPGTRTGLALDLAADLLAQAGGHPGQVLLISDGGGAGAASAAATRLARAGHRLSVIGAGTVQGSTVPTDTGVLRDASGRAVVSRLDEAALRSLAAAGNGRYARMGVDDRDLDVALARRWPGWRSVSELAGLASDRWREEGPWLLLALLPLASLVFRRGLLVLTLAVALPAPRPATALDWAAPWRTADQRGLSALEARDYPRAATLFEDPEWRAAALHRAGRFEEAAAVLAPLRHPRALYNRGNALAHLGQRERAMALFEQVLDADPEHADARYNLELLRAMAPPPQAPGGGGGRDEQASPGSPRAAERPPAEDGGDGGGQRQGGESSPSAGGSPDAHSPDGPGRAGDTPPAGGDPQAGAADGEPAPGPEAAREPARAAASGDDLTTSEETSRQVMRQWLRQIEDDPAGLLRRKFRYQYSRRPAPADSATPPW